MRFVNNPAPASSLPLADSRESRILSIKRTSRLTLALANAAGPAAILGLFLPSLLGFSQLAFRDVGHFYTPLYGYVAERTHEQWLPLWNPLDQTGIPLVGETTTAVLYPLRYLVYSLPLTTDTALVWYIVLHLLVASVTAQWAAWCCGSSRASAMIAGVIYPLSGSVLFLYSNPPFLVAAAWLPLVIGICFRTRAMDRRWCVVIQSLALSLMVLGGDPQTALHAVMISAVIIIAFAWLREYRKAVDRGTVLVASCVAALLMTCPQIVASMDWSRQSYRVLNDETQLYFLQPPRSSLQNDALEYSVAPWALIELVTPAAWGDLFPINRRLSTLIPEERKLWTQSLYAGMFSVLGLLIATRRRQNRWFIFLVAMSVLLVLGHFGLGALLRNISPQFSNVGSAVGGAYWWLYHFFPGYDSFRYPAKWLPFLSIGLAILASSGLDRSSRSRFAFPKRVVVSLAISLLILFAGVCLLRFFWQPTGRLPTDRFWGPLDVFGGLAIVQISLVHSSVVLGLILWAKRRLGTARHRDLYVAAIILLAAFDLALAARQWIGTVDSAALHQVMSSTQRMETAHRWLRTQSGGGFPMEWRRTSSDLRMLEVEASQRDAWFGRWHLKDRQAVFNNMTSIRSSAIERFWQATDDVSRNSTTDETRVLWRNIREWLAIDATLLSSDKSRTLTIDGTTLQLAQVQRHAYRPQPSTVQFFTSWRQQPVANNTRREMALILRELKDSHEPICYSDEFLEFSQRASDDDSIMHEQVVHDGVESVEVLLQNSQAVLIVRPQLQDGNWHATLLSLADHTRQPAAVHSVDLLKQGVIVPPGNWKVAIEYRPKWLVGLSFVSAVAWIYWFVSVGHVWYRSRLNKLRLVANPPGALKPQSLPSEPTTR